MHNHITRFKMYAKEILQGKKMMQFKSDSSMTADSLFTQKLAVVTMLKYIVFNLNICGLSYQIKVYWMKLMITHVFVIDKKNTMKLRYKQLSAR